MKRQESKACTLRDKVVPHGVDECVEGKCMICIDGEWKERIDACASSAK